MATAANVVKLKRSAVAGRVPATADLALGEIALNTYDGRVYLKKSVSAVESIVTLQPFPTGGTNGYVLQTDGNGALSWVAQAAGVAPYQLVNNGYTATLNNTGTLTVDNLVVTAETNVTTQTFVVTSIGNLLLSEDGQVLELPPNQAPITTENFNAVIIGANTGSWYFKSQGVLQLPPGGDITDSNGNTVLGGGGGGGSAYSVNYTSQSLTDNQTAQARANIGAASQDDAFVAAMILG